MVDRVDVNSAGIHGEWRHWSERMSHGILLPFNMIQGEVMCEVRQPDVSFAVCDPIQPRGDGTVPIVPSRNSHEQAPGPLYEPGERGAHDEEEAALPHCMLMRRHCLGVTPLR